jgi:polar amino acid transport system permease protein
VTSATPPRTPPRTKPATSGTTPKAVPVRHYGQWVAAAVVLLLLALLVQAVATNEVIQWDVIRSRIFFNAILGGLVTTIWLTVASMALGVIGGVVFAVMRLSDNRLLRSISAGFVWLFRGTPVLVQILIFYNLALFFPRLGFGFLSVSTNDLITPFTAALLALALNEMAYMSEIVRGGILAVDTGQREAAEALGMTSGHVLRRIILPQAMRVIIPPMGNELVTLLKTTSLVAVIGAGDLLTKAQAVGATDFTRLEMLIVASIWYLVLTTVASVGQVFLERRFLRGTTQSGRRPSTLRRIAADLRPGRNRSAGDVPTIIPPSEERGAR